MRFYINLAFLLLTATANAFISIPQKFADPEFTRPIGTESRFSREDVQSNQFIATKKKEWKACHQRSGNDHLFAEGHDPIALILETNEFLTDIKEMDSRNLQKAQVSIHPWSGDYWAYAKGILAARYQDPAFDRLYDWISRYNYIQQNPVPLVIQNQGQSGVDLLSPAEKYDLIIGNQESSFAASLWSQGKSYYDESGDVEGWMGICHGWAPAAIMEPRPQKSIDVVSLDQKWKIHLTPSDIKGLTSYSWATNHFPAATLGARCNEKNPKKDKNGRLLNPDCFDLNPGSWHIAIVNLIGAMDRSFVMDATYDYEVWNQPVIGYSYTYFNPITGMDVKDLSSGTVALKDYDKDPYQKYRSKRTVQVVGVKMRVGYVVENSASNDETDSEDRDISRWVQYEYDLELDSDGKIIGGEWYTMAHPDFIWTPKKDSKPYSPMESSISQGVDWSDGQPVPASWADAARAGSDSGYILNQITEKILEKAVRPQ